MLSLLSPPDSVTIDGVDYKINTDFRVWLRIGQLFSAKELSPPEAVAAAFAAAYPDLPHDPQGALTALCDFYSMKGAVSGGSSPEKEAAYSPSGGAESGDDFSSPMGIQRENGNDFTKAASSKSGSGSGTAPIFDYEYDMPYIYGSFLSEFGIDLSRADLHWWQFRALMQCLGDSCAFSRVVAIRSANLSEIRDKAQRGRMKRLKQLYALPDRRSREERDLASAEMIAKAFGSMM